MAPTVASSRDEPAERSGGPGVRGALGIARLDLGDRVICGHGFPGKHVTIIVGRRLDADGREPRL